MKRRTMISKIVILITLLISGVYADVELSYDFSLVDGRHQGNIKWKNRQTEYYWSNNVLPVVAVGFTLGTHVWEYPGRTYFQTLDDDADGLTQYRLLYPRGERASIFPGEEETYGGPKDVTFNLTNAGQSLDKQCPYPRYPHIVLKEKPWYGLNYPNTHTYAPPISSDDIDETTGAVKGQSDYYDSTAWIARNDAPLLVSEEHHPTQLWLGMPHVKPGETIKDAANASDWYKGDAMGSSGAFIAPNSPTGEGVLYNHTNGEGPGGLMLSMAASFGQEMFGYDMRVPFAISSKESWACVFWDSSYTSYSHWKHAGTHGQYGAGKCNKDPYQMTDASIMQIAYQSIPDYLPHEVTLREYYFDLSWYGQMRSNIVNATVTFYMTLSSIYYGYPSASRAHRLDEFAANSADDYSLLRTVAYGYAAGKDTPPILNMRYGQQRPRMLTEKNLSKSDGMVGANSYAPQVVDMVRRLGNTDNVYDWGITWGDVEDFLSDLRAFHYANGVPSDAQWSAMKDDMRSAFDKMAGKAPTPDLRTDQISFRYNWLTLLRIMKSYLPNSREKLPVGSAFYSAKKWGGHTGEFLGAYHPQFKFSDVSNDIDKESEGPLPDTNTAPEIYWVAPRYTFPTKDQGFPVLGTFPNKDIFEITADVLDDGVGGGDLRVRYCVSPGDPQNGGHSFWRDGVNTGGTENFPVESDWVTMDDIGKSQTPAGGRRFQGIFDASGVRNETRRVYIESSDNSGYRTISWVDVFFEGDELEELILTADPVSGTHFIEDTTVTLSATNSAGNPVSDVTIYYTIDGSDPTVSSEKYTGPFILSGEEYDVFVVKAIAIKTGYVEAKGEWTYYQDGLKNLTLSADPVTGTHFIMDTSITLTVTDTNGDPVSGVQIYYTIDGSDPTVSSEKYTGPITQSGNMNDIFVVKAIAIKTGYVEAKGEWTYYQDGLPTLVLSADPVTGTHFILDTTITLAVTDNNGDPVMDVQIYYTTDGSEPTETSDIYTGPITLSGVVNEVFVVKAVALATGYEEAKGVWTYHQDGLNTWIEADPSDTSYGEELTVSLTTNGDKIYYTTNGEKPDTNDVSQLYSGSFTISGGDVTVKAIAVGKGMEPSEGSWTYIQVTLPEVVALPPGQEFTDDIDVILTLTEDWPEVKIYYTLNDPAGEPDESDLLFDGTPIKISETTILKAKAFAPNALASALCEEFYTKILCIDSGSYYDQDGDGAIDFAQLHASDSIDILPREIRLTNPFINESYTIDSTKLSWVENDPTTKTIDVIIPEPFPFSHVTHFTPEDLGEVTQGDYVKKKFIIHDRVAPVIDKAEFRPGSLLGEGSDLWNDDTLIVTFTEKVNGFGTGVGQYFNLVTTSGTAYHFDVTLLSNDNEVAVFTIASGGIHGVRYPSSSDSIWIRIEDNLSDEYGNVQSVRDNRRIPLEVSGPRDWIVTLTALNPFTPMMSGGNINAIDLHNQESMGEFLEIYKGLLVEVVFSTDLSMEEFRNSIDITLDIYDQTGNSVASLNSLKESNIHFISAIDFPTVDGYTATRVLLYWTGMNHNNRRIGSGSYLGLFEVMAKSSHEAGIKTVKFMKTLGCKVEDR